MHRVSRFYKDDYLTLLQQNIEALKLMVSEKYTAAFRY